MKERLGILISGDGSTAASIISATLSGDLKMDVACLISSKPDAGGMKIARILMLDPDNIIYLNPKLPEFPENLLKNLQTRGVTVVTQNGWLPKTPKNVIDAYKDTIFNQHPGPVPEFGGKRMYGIRVHHAVLLYRRFTGGQMWTEVTAHRVENKLDSGMVVKKRIIPILPSDTPEILQGRCLPFEHEAQIQLLKDVAAGTVWGYPKYTVKPWAQTRSEKRLLAQAKRAAIATYPGG